MRSTDGSSYHVMLSGDNGGGPETQEMASRQSTANVGVTCGYLLVCYLQLHNSFIANVHIHCVL